MSETPPQAGLEALMALGKPMEYPIGTSGHNFPSIMQSHEATRAAGHMAEDATVRGLAFAVKAARDAQPVFHGGDVAIPDERSVEPTRPYIPRHASSASLTASGEGPIRATVLDEAPKDMHVLPRHATFEEREVRRTKAEADSLAKLMAIGDEAKLREQLVRDETVTGVVVDASSAPRVTRGQQAKRIVVGTGKVAAFVAKEGAAAARKIPVAVPTVAKAVATELKETVKTRQQERREVREQAERDRNYMLSDLELREVRDQDERARARRRGLEEQLRQQGAQGRHHRISVPDLLPTDRLVAHGPSDVPTTVHGKVIPVDATEQARAADSRTFLEAGEGDALAAVWSDPGHLAREQQRAGQRHGTEAAVYVPQQTFVERMQAMVPDRVANPFTHKLESELASQAGKLERVYGNIAGLSPEDQKTRMAFVDALLADSTIEDRYMQLNGATGHYGARAKIEGAGSRLKQGARLGKAMLEKTVDMVEDVVTNPRTVILEQQLKRQSRGLQSKYGDDLPELVANQLPINELNPVDEAKTRMAFVDALLADPSLEDRYALLNEVTGGKYKVQAAMQRLGERVEQITDTDRMIADLKDRDIDHAHGPGYREMSEEQQGERDEQLAYLRRTGQFGMLKSLLGRPVLGERLEYGAKSLGTALAAERVKRGLRYVQVAGRAALSAAEFAGLIEIEAPERQLELTR
ncbi:MAG TPA: hypothetical protein VLH38_04180 [Patescibacteria group bacterium]|nr:hypothetical protein [Patescibacteria group bacterium]